MFFGGKYGLVHGRVQNLKYFFCNQFGSNKTLGAHLGKPTYVWPYTLKRVVREVIPGDQVDRPDLTHAKVSSKFLNFLRNQ